MSEKPSNTDKLLDLLGGKDKDPAKRPTLTDEILKKALDELEEKRTEQALEKARELIGKAVELRQQAYKAEQEFNRNKAKFDKELGKLLNQLRTGVDQAIQGAEDKEEDGQGLTQEAE